MKIGILALQGGYEAHARMLTQVNVDWAYIRYPEELTTVDGLIIPGGESSTLLHLAHKHELFTALQQSRQYQLPIFGTCAGAILLAKYVISPAQVSLGFIDVTIERNGYGRQLASCIVQGHWNLTGTYVPMMFIRAPRIRSLLPDVKILAHYQNEPVCVQQGNYLLATFHPELTENTTLHQHFVDMVNDKLQLAA